MYRNILLAYDGSLEGRVALREGALLARRLEARVFLLGVTTQPQLVDPASGVVAVNSEAVAIFENGLQKARDLGLEVQGELVHGDPVHEISVFAERIDADLVVVGHRRQSFVERWWAGPGQAALVDRLTCSLLVARGVKGQRNDPFATS